MRKLFVIMILVFVPWLAQAQESQEDCHYGLGVGMDFSRDAYEFDVNFTWYPVETFGLRASIGCSGEYREMFDDIYDDWRYEYDYYNNYTWRFKFSPSIELRSPALIKFGDDKNIRLFANPGITLSPGASGSMDAKWFTWQVRGGIEVNFGIVSLQFGYRCTNFYLYSGNPYSETDYEVDRDLIPDRYTHSGFISAVFHF